MLRFSKARIDNGLCFNHSHSALDRLKAYYARADALYAIEPRTKWQDAALVFTKDRITILKRWTE